MTAIISLLVVLLVAMTVTRVASVALRLTGMSPDAARFQARSAFTGCGYTTTEAEQIANHPVRRRITGWLMMAGNLQIAAVSGTLLLSLIGIREGASGVQLAVLFGGLVGVYLLTSSKLVDGVMCGMTSWLLRRFTTIHTQDYVSLLHLSEDFAITEVPLHDGHSLVGEMVGDCVRTGCGAVILGVTDSSGEYCGLPSHDRVLVPGDTLLVYGHRDIAGVLCPPSTAPQGPIVA